MSATRSPPRETSRRTAPRWALHACVVLAVAVLYGNTLANPFWETDAFLYQLLSERALADPSPASLDRIYGFVVHSPKGWADIGTFATWLAVHAVAGVRVVPYHLLVVSLHLACALLLLETVLGAGRSRAQALATALLFVATPLVEEVVTVPAKMDYALFAAFALGALLAFRRWCMVGGLPRLALAAAATIAAGLSKEFVIVVPPLVVLAALRPMTPDVTGPHAPPRAARIAGATLLAVLALPTFVRPLWLSLAPASAATATAPADVAMGDDIAEFLAPRHLLPKLIGDLGRFGLVPFSADADYARCFPFHVALMAAALTIGVLGRTRAGPADRPLLLAAGVWIVVGYGLVGFHISRDSFEKTGELYAAAVGISILGGELFAGGKRVGSARRVALVAVLGAMTVHSLSLHTLSRVHGERVESAAATLRGLVDAATPDTSIVVLGEPFLDRGAVDAVVLSVAFGRESPLPPIHLVNGSRSEQVAADCPPGVLDVTAPTVIALRWDEHARALTELRDSAARLAAMRWRNPDPEDNLEGTACGSAEDGWVVADVDLLRDLSPATILPRL